jgi:hypothetical protein
MSVPITAEDVSSRLLNFPHDRYLYIGGFMRSVALAAGTLVLLKIVLDFKKYGPRLLPWIASLLATLVTLMTWGRGVLLTNSRANMLDAIIPTLMGVTEFCLFAILLPREQLIDQKPGTDNNMEPWYRWFLVLATHTLLAVFLVLNRIFQTNVQNDFEQTLHPLAKEYIGWMWGDIIGAAVSTVIFAAIGISLIKRAPRTKDDGKGYERRYARFAIVPILIFAFVIFMAENQRQWADDFVSSHNGKVITPEPAASPTPSANNNSQTTTR